MSAPLILGKPKSDLLAAVGTALLQVKNARRLTAEDMADVFGLRADDQVAKYIAGTESMSVTAWLRASEAWPELGPKLIEQLELNGGGK
jgi:hypothetical protein